MFTSDFVITGMCPVEKYQRKDLTEGMCQLITVVNKYDGDIALATKLYAPFVPNELHPGDEIRLSYKMKIYNGKQTGIPMTYIIAHDIVPIYTSAPVPFAPQSNINNNEGSNNEANNNKGSNNEANNTEKTNKEANNENDNLVPQANNDTTLYKNNNE